MPTRAFQLNINFVPISLRFRCIGVVADCPPADVHTVRTFDAKKDARDNPKWLNCFDYWKPMALGTLLRVSNLAWTRHDDWYAETAAGFALG